MAISEGVAAGGGGAGSIGKPIQKADSELQLRRELGGAVWTQAVLPACVFAGYFASMLRVATPSDGSAATPMFFQDISLAVPAAATAIYIVMCIVGPRIMQNRPAFELKGVMLSYNLYQSLLSVWSVFMFVYEVRRIGCRPWGNVDAGVQHPEWATDARYGRLMGVLWLHYNNKFVELLDSVFMILRKKNEQLSFLHCYHHALLIWCAQSPPPPPDLAPPPPSSRFRTLRDWRSRSLRRRSPFRTCLASLRPWAPGQRDRAEGPAGIFPSLTVLRPFPTALGTQGLGARDAADGVQRRLLRCAGPFPPLPLPTPP